MSSVSQIENTVKKTYEWLNELAAMGKYQNAAQAYSVLRAVLHTLRDRLPFEVSVNFAAQLPMLLVGVYYNGWEPSILIRDHEVEDFINEVVQKERSLEVNAKESIGITFQFLKSKMDPPVIDKIVGTLPAKLKKLWNE